MRLECAVGKDDRELYFKGAQLRYNSPFEFKTDKYSAQVKIAKMYESMPSPLKEKWLSLQVKFSGIIPEVANVITEGDVEKDPTGKITGRLKAIISSRSSDVLILKKGKFITLAHPFQKDVVVLLDLFCVEKDGILYFKNYPVKMGNAVTFTTDLYSISGMIVGVENK
ncbi:MAG TPA: hypothetical protein ENH41_01445 [Candidatus Omnitrophica bacterium]|nr:hypothetical protein [Candidatus Omnitrophota bacterium]